MEYPTGRFDVVQDDIGYLYYQPRYDYVGNAYLKYVTAFEFVEK